MPEPRKRAPGTNPTLAVARAEAGRPQPARRAAAKKPTEPVITVELPPAVMTRPDDPPIFREVWNQLYGIG